MTNKISIITPSFNRADIIHETAESIFNQSNPNWEWVITDDGSTDNSWEILQQLALRDSRVKIFRRDREPKGACTCRNISIQKATGDYLIFLDTDDVLAPFCIEQRIQAASEHPKADFIIFPMMLFKKSTDDMGVLWNIDKETDDIRRFMTGDAICQGTGTIWKKSSFVNIGMWDESLKLWQDVELHLRALLGGCRYVKRMDLKPDIYLRISDESLSRTGFHSRPKLESRIRVFRSVVEKMQEKNIIGKYKIELRILLRDLIASASNSAFFDLTKQVMQLPVVKQLFSPSEIQVMRRYFFVRKFKIYKIPFLGNKAASDLSKLETNPPGTIGKFKYEEELIAG